VPAEKIQRRVLPLAAQISDDYAGQEIDLVCLCHSAMMFAADAGTHITGSQGRPPVDGRKAVRGEPKSEPLGCRQTGHATARLYDGFTDAIQFC
jgi:hypothetical protein